MLRLGLKTTPGRQSADLVTVERTCPRATRCTGRRVGCRALVGQRIAAESPHPRAQAERVAERIDGRTLESVDALGKNLVLRFEGGVVVRSHLRMSGRWSVRPRGERRVGTPWLVLRGDRAEGDSLERAGARVAHARARAARPGHPRAAAAASTRCSQRLRRADATRWLGETLLDQSLVAGIGNMWLAESLWDGAGSRRGGASRDVAEDERRRALESAAALMRASVDGGRGGRQQVYRRVGQPCPRCDARSGRGGRATTTAPRTGAPRAR